MSNLFTPLIPFLTGLALFIDGGLYSNQNEDSDNGVAPVYMLTYDHGGLILWGTDHFEERLDNAIEWLDKYPGFKIGLDNEAYVYDYLAENDPELLNKIRRYLSEYEGRFGIGSCTYGQPLSTFIGSESNIRQIAYALEANKKYFGYKNKIYLMSEHAMHAQIPQIIKGFGFDGAIMRTHYMMYGYNPTYDKPFGLWTGMDGTEIKTVPTYEGEGAAFGKTTVDNWILTRYPGQDAQISLNDFKKQFQDINPLLATRADDSDLRKEELVKEYEGNTSYRWILLDELLDLYPDPTNKFITKPDDFTVRMPWGYCGNEIWNMSRKAEVQLLTTERLATFGYLMQGSNYEKDLDKSWKHLLLAQHHDVQIVGLLPDAREHLFSSIRLSNDIREKVWQELLEVVEGDGYRKVMVFSPLSYKERQWIRTKVRFKRGEAKDVAVYYEDQRIPSTILTADRFSSGHILECEIAFLAEFENLGIKTYQIHPIRNEEDTYRSNMAVDHERLKIKTDIYDIELSENGGIKSLVNLKTGKSIFQPGTRNGFLTGLIDGIMHESDGQWIISKTHPGMPWITATEYGFIANIPYEMHLKIEEGNPRIDWKITVKLDSQKIGQLSHNPRESTAPFIHEKKLRFKFFPELGPAMNGVRDLPFVIAETDDKYIQGNYWTALEDDKNGLAVFNKGTMCQVLEDDGGSSIPLIYAMYYIWGTRMLKGDFQFEIALYPYKGTHQSAGIHNKALFYNFPFINKTVPANHERDEKEFKQFDIPSEEIILTALHVRNDKIVVRLFNSTSTDSHFQMKHRWTDNKIFETDLNGRIIGKIEQNVVFRPWQFKTLEFDK